MTEEFILDDSETATEEETPVFNSDEAKKVLDEIELKIEGDETSVEELAEELSAEEPIKGKRGRKKAATTEPTPNGKTADEMTTKELYMEFNQFINEKFGFSDEVEIKGVIPTGIDLLDAILGGGFAIGAMTVITGAPGGFKSTLAAQFMASAQMAYDGEILGVYLDSEEAASTVRLANLGVRRPRIKPRGQISVEKVFKTLEGMCVFKALRKVEKPSVVIWDSIANTLSEKEMEAEDPNSVIGYKARLLSLLIPKYVSKCAKHNICLIAINQLRDKLQMGQFAPKADLRFMSHSKDMPGGTAVKYNAFHLLEMNLEKILDADKLYGFDGVTVSVKTVKNKLAAANVKISLVVNPLTGISNFWSNYAFLVENNRIKSGAWNYMINFPERKFRTKDAEITYKEDQEFKLKFDELVKEAIKIELIDKYNPNNLFEDEE